MKKAKELSLDRLIELVEDNLPDPSRPGGNIRHKLVDLLVIRERAEEIILAELIFI